MDGRCQRYAHADHGVDGCEYSGYGYLRQHTATYYTLTLSLIGSGVITPTAGSHTYLAGASVGLKESPAPDWHLSGWNGDADCADGSVTLNANKNCVAMFARYQI